MPEQTAVAANESREADKWLRRYLSYATRDLSKRDLSPQERASMLRAMAGYLYAVTGCRFEEWQLARIGISEQGAIVVFDRPAGEADHRPVAHWSAPDHCGQRRTLRTGFTPHPAPSDAALECRSHTRPRGAGRPAVRRSSSQRSSARSGDSGDDGEPSEPPPAARFCRFCGGDFGRKNSDARFCSAKCRVYASRARDKADPDRVARRAVENGVAGRATLCKCDPPGHLVVEGRCLPCGHDRVEVAA